MKLPFGSNRAKVTSGFAVPGPLSSPSTKISTSCPASPSKVTTVSPPSGTVPVPSAMTRTTVGGCGSNGSFHWNTIRLPSSAWIVCAMSRTGPASKSWKPPAYSAGSTPLKSRLVLAQDCARPGTMRTAES